MCAHYTWRELSVHLCNHEIQRSRFHVTIKVKQWGMGVQGGDGVEVVPLFTQNPTNWN